MEHGNGGYPRWDLTVAGDRAASPRSQRASVLPWGGVGVCRACTGERQWRGIAYSRGHMMASRVVLGTVAPWHCSGLGALGCEQRGRRDGANPSAPSTVATGWLGTGKTASLTGPPLCLSPLSALTCHLPPSHSSTTQEHPRHKAESRYMGDHPRHKKQSKILCILGENNPQTSVKNRFRKQKFRK